MYQGKVTLILANMHATSEMNVIYHCFKPPQFECVRLWIIPCEYGHRLGIAKGNKRILKLLAPTTSSLAQRRL